MTIDNLVGCDIVTADGRLLRASADSTPSCSGRSGAAAGTSAIVTSLELDLHPVGPVLWGGEVIHPGARDVEALRALVDLAGQVPDEARLMAALVTAPDAPFVPPEAVGTPVCVLASTHCGPVEQGRAALAPLSDSGPVVDLLRELTYVELQQRVDQTLPPARRAYVKSDFLGPLDDAALAVLANWHHRASSPYCQLLLHQLGGALDREPEGGTAYPARGAAWMVTAIAIWLDPAEAPEPHVAWARGAWEAMRPWSVGTYVNHLGDEGADRVREAYGTSYERLVALKEEWDGDNVFRLNQNLAPRPRLG